MPASDIPWALDQFRGSRLKNYDLSRKYYDGDHRLLFEEKRFESVFGQMFQAVRENLCPAVVDAMADRLKITGFSSSAAERKEETVNGRPRIVVDDPLAAAAASVWKRNQMRLRAAEVHRESVKVGDGFAIVWPDANGEAAIWPQYAHEMAVEYSEDTPGVVTRAAKLWRGRVGPRGGRKGSWRLTLYYPDTIERYIHRMDALERVREDRFVPFQRDPSGPVLENPYERVPVFHFPHKRLHCYGVSHLHDVIPIQDALNKAICDLLVGMEFQAFRQRWVTGLDVGETDEEGKPLNPPFDYGADRMLFSADKDAKFGDFAAAELEQILAVQERFASAIARVTGTPLHYLFITRGDFPSGEAMKSAEARFSNQLGDRQEATGPVWEDLLTFALQVDGMELPDRFDLDALWQTTSPRSEKEQNESLLMKKALGVSRSQLLKEAGYDDETIDRMLEEGPIEDGDDSDGIVIPTATGRERA